MPWPQLKFIWIANSFLPMSLHEQDIGTRMTTSQKWRQRLKATWFASPLNLPVPPTPSCLTAFGTTPWVNGFTNACALRGDSKQH